jgi:glycerate dehydrogenase
MRVTVLDAETLGNDVDIGAFSEFGELTVYQNTNATQLDEHLQNTEVAVLNKVKLGKSELEKANRLRLICVAATGFDNIDLATCREKGIAVCNVLGYSTQSVAQVTLAMALSLMTHLKEYTDYVRNGSYSASGIANRLTPVYHEIAGKTWGIIGLGNIGKQVGTVAKAMGCHVLANKRTPDLEWNCVDLETLCRESDIISLHAPLNDSTRNLIDRKHISLMKKEAIFINVARGAITDEAALAEAVQEGKLGGLGIDVYSVEPFLKDHPYQKILHLPNVCMTPHMAWGGYETRVRLIREMVENIRAFNRGERRNRVD